MHEILILWISLKTYRYSYFLDLSENVAIKSYHKFGCAAAKKRPSPGRLVTWSVLCMPSPAIAYPGHTHPLHPCQSGEEKYQDEEGQSICTDCGVGKYQHEEGQSICTNCPIGWSSQEDEKETCEKCDAGTFGSVKGLCTNCPEGYYQNAEGKSSCKTCPQGWGVIVNLLNRL